MCLSYLRSATRLSNGFQKFAVAPLRSATRFCASSSAAGPSSSDSYSVPYEMSSSSSSSSSSELLSSGTSEEEGQEEEEEGIESVGGKHGERRYLPRWRRIPVFERVHSIDTGSYEDNQLAEVSLFEAHGYYTFAREVPCESGLVDDEHTLIHICCPWLPQYIKTEYYEARSGLEIRLDPLTVPWESFIQRVDKIVMITKQEAFIVIRVFKADVLEHDVMIPKSVCLSYQKFKKAIYFYHTSYEKRDPDDLSPVYYPWPGAELEYYDGREEALIMPEEGEEGEGGEEEEEEEQEEDNGGEIVDDGEGEDNEIIQEDEEDDVMAENTPWETFMENLFSVHINILD